MYYPNMLEYFPTLAAQHKSPNDWQVNIQQHHGSSMGHICKYRYTNNHQYRYVYYRYMDIYVHIWDILWFVYGLYMVYIQLLYSLYGFCMVSTFEDRLFDSGTPEVAQLLARQRSYLDQPKVTYCQARWIDLTKNWALYCYQVTNR